MTSPTLYAPPQPVQGEVAAGTLTRSSVRRGIGWRGRFAVPAIVVGLALWFGLTAPSTSPVGPAVDAPAVRAPVTPVTVAPAPVTAVAPGAPVDNSPRGRR